MSPGIRNLCTAAAVAGLVAAGGCASEPLSTRAAAIPVFSREQAHPGVVRALGPVRAYICLDPRNAASYEADVQNALRRKAESKGATALIDYRSQVLNNSPRQYQCRRFVKGEAVAAVTGGA